MKAYFRGCDVATVQDVANRNGMTNVLSIIEAHSLFTIRIMVEGFPADIMKFIGAMGQEGKYFLVEVNY